MNTVKDALAQKSGALIHVRSGDMVVEALRQMRDNFATWMAIRFTLSAAKKKLTPRMV